MVGASCYRMISAFMGYKQIPIPNSRLTEGEVYPFLITKSVSLGPGDDWFVLKDPLGYKILMPKAFYKDYGFDPGQTIQCRVDKINCNGRMFLEPAHPHYREGEVYRFDVTGSGHRINILDQDEYYLQVSDVFGNAWEVMTANPELVELPPHMIECLVRRIKKGKLFLEIHGEKRPLGGLKPGRTYVFEVADEKMNPDDGHSYYILSDSRGRRHLLRKKYYHHYGIRKGMKVRCRVERLGTEGHYFLEPEHPCYGSGNTYSFPIDRFQELVFSDGFRQAVMVLKDCHGEEVRVHVPEDLARSFEGHTVVNARVRAIRKSRLELDVESVI
jgi:hypothetical protein